MKTIPERLNIILKKKSLKPADLARILGKSKGNITNILKGDVKPGAEFLFLLNQNLGVSIDWLLTGKGNMFIEEENPQRQEHEEGKKDRILEEIQKILEENGIK